MYVTRRLSGYQASPELLSNLHSSDNQQRGPNSGFLVIQDEESEATCCFGLCTDSKIRDLPLPQNKILSILYPTDQGVDTNHVILIPVLDQPLSSNRYYAIVPHGRHRGETYANSREAEMGTCCFCRYIKDVKPMPLLNPHNPYQQVEIYPYQGGCSSNRFRFKSVAPDGFPPNFLRRRGFEIHTSRSRKLNLNLEDAPGLDAACRARLPDFDFPMSQKSSGTVVVGKWYCPFMFIKEPGMSLRDQAKKSLYYGMALEQRWERIYECMKDDRLHNGNSVELDCLVKMETVWVGGYEGTKEHLADGFMWFGGVGDAGKGVRVGLGLGIWERMRWELEQVGGAEHDGEVEVKRVEAVGGLQATAGWKKVGFYVLVERFVLRRMDGSLVLCYDSKHTHQLRSKWE